MILSRSFTSRFNPQCFHTSSMFSKRLFSSSNSSKASQRKSIWRSFDSTMYYPAILIILFGSQIINVMNSQRSVEDLERRYKLKIDKIEEIRLRLLNKEKIDVEKELQIVNKIFDRQASHTQTVFKQTKQHDLKFDDELNDEALNKMLGLDSILDESISKKPGKSSSIDSIHFDTNDIKRQIEEEKELVNYKLNPEHHVIVEKPGDYIEAARDTKVTKFL